MSDKRWVGFLLWVLAFFAMVGAAIYQRRTGPTYPQRGSIEVEGKSAKYALVRSNSTSYDARVELPALPGLEASLSFKRYKTADTWTEKPFIAEYGDDDMILVATLPRQPAAGKLEYFIETTTPSGKKRIPEGEEPIIIRYKDDVPTPLLFSHVAFMFFGVLIGMRAGLAAICGRADMRRLTWVTFSALTMGGMILGPFVQKYAFGEFWTGFPWGYDLTDNKMLIMWVVWLIACTTIGIKARADERIGRAVVLVAMVIMMAVYLIPHSMRGSELDYSKVDQGVDPAEAIGTGR